VKKIPLISPLSVVSKRVWLIVAGVEILIALIFWQLSGGGLIPGPGAVFKALGQLFSEPDFMNNLLSSFSLTLKGMSFSIVIALIISYLSMLPFFSPVAKFVVQCRYLTLTGLIFLFTLLTKNGSDLKISLLIFGIVPFFVTSLLSIFASINSQEFDLCRTLRMNDWETLYEVVILGRLDQVLEVMRQNFAISWLMITMVEGQSMSEGGLGVMLIKANKYVNLPKVFAILVVIFAIGILFDVLLGTLRRWLFPYSKLQVAK
jgi:ABC-type nitrate/sulfonate/bicarbonate transport system permease component